MKIIPSKQKAKVWDPQNAKVFFYKDKMTIEADGNATFAELNGGKGHQVISFHGILDEQCHGYTVLD